MSPPPANSDEHACDWKRYATDLAELLAEKQAALDALTAERDALVAARFGGKRRSQKAPKLPSDRPKADPAETARKRRKAAEQRAQAELEEVVVLSAPAPAKLYDRAQYGAGLAAHVVVGKCVDAIPLYRMAKIIARTGVPVSDRSLDELLTRSAELLTPLYLRLEELIRQEPVVMAEETLAQFEYAGSVLATGCQVLCISIVPGPVPAKDKTRRGYIWTFRAAEVVLYRASAGRSGETSQQVLGATTGTLLTDGYSGYNQVTTPAGRQRAGDTKVSIRIEQAPIAPSTKDSTIADHWLGRGHTRAATSSRRCRPSRNSPAR